MTVVVPSHDLVGEVTAALSGLPATAAIRPELLRSRLPGVMDVLGPAVLFYELRDLAAVPAQDEVVSASLADVEELLGSVSADELDESGLREVTSQLFVAIGEDGRPKAACGYRHWPQRIGHLCVLTHPQHRGHGLGRAVAGAAIASAVEEGLLPQWRARLAPSKALARSLGLAELGAQLGLRLDNR